MSILGLLTTTDVVSVYNIFAKQSGTATVKKFRDKSTGHQRLQDITRGKDRRIVVAAMKQVGIRPEIIKMLPDTPVTVAVPNIATPAPTAPKKVDAAKVLTEAKVKEDLRHDKESKKTRAIIRKELKLTDHAAAVLSKLYELCDNKDKETTTTIIAEKLKTSFTAVSKALDSLKKLELVKIEDDSPDDEHPLWYVSITKKGYEADAKKACAFVSKDNSITKPAKSLPADRPGPRSSKVGKKIHKLVDGNPRREGTHGHKSFALIKNGMTYEEYIKAGGRNNDLAWDIDHGYVELK